MTLANELSEQSQKGLSDPWTFRRGGGNRFQWTSSRISAKRHDCIFVAVDRLSKMVHIKAINQTISATGLAAVYTDRVFHYHGVYVNDLPAKVSCLIGIHASRAFFWRELASRLGTKLRMSTAYHPKTDVQTEHVNGILEDTTRHFVGPYKTGMSCWRRSLL